MVTVGKNVRFIIAFFVVIGIFAGFVPASEAVIRIMPLGDSITRGFTGSSDKTGYRRELDLTLTGDGYPFDFVGNLVEPIGLPNDFDKDHEGHSGFTDGDLAAEVYNYLTTNPADIILLHIGTNNVDIYQSATQVEAILDEIDRYETDNAATIWVILALIINRNCITGGPPCLDSDRTTDYNNNVRVMAQDRIVLDGDKILFVDMENEAGIDYNLSTHPIPGDMWDNLHPFDTGFEKMADQWFSAIQQVTLPVANAGIDQSVFEGGTVTLDASESTDPENSNLSFRWVQTAGTFVELSDNQVAQPTFVAPEVGSGGETLKFRVTVADTDELESTDTVSIDVVFSDDCPNDPNKIEPGICGCGVPDVDSDGDGLLDCNDGCPADSGKTQPGVCGCGAIDIDTDHDGAPDCVDNCSNNPGKINPGICGCGISDIDSDGDGLPDCNDGCPADYKKTQPGICDCGVIETDRDNDGTPDCVDNCPNNPAKINPGICGCGASDADTDGDGIPVCSDGCPADSNKSQPGICGCGVIDIDTDHDGTPDCVDNCPNDLNKNEMGTCGCDVADVDSDADGIFDCTDTNGDNDGASDAEEQGPDGDNPNYDGNGDGIADWLQNNVTSLHTYNDRSYVTIESPDGTSIGNGKAVANPAAASAPPEVSFSDGFFEFKIFGVSKGGATTVRLHFPVGSNFDTYYKFGPTENNLQNHWYEFFYSGQTGAEIDGNIITLHLVDGLTGDDDLISDGIIIDIGAPGNIAAAGDIASESDGGGGSGGGGGGCFIGIATDGFQGSNGTLVLTLLLGIFVTSVSVLKFPKKQRVKVE